MRIVRAEVLAALHLGHGDERVAALIERSHTAYALPSGSQA